MNEQALKDRLRIIAKEKGILFNEVLKQLFLERFLARISSSQHHDKFIFKGGLLLAHYLEIGRETIEKVVREIVSENLPDGLNYSWNGIEDIGQPHMGYPGFRVSINIICGGMKDKIQLDIGVGDKVNPVEEELETFEYKGKPLFAGKISLQVYPVEAIFAEKLETIISKGAINSRMKDYHDALLIIREEKLLPKTKAKAAIKATFENRGTELKASITFDDAGIKTLQRLWSAHLRGLGDFRKKLNLPDEISVVIKELNAWMKKISL
jgi:predicted nucleotidyltransferase component of viral defense system